VNILQLIVYPISLFYGVLTSIRNLLYDGGIFKSVKFDFPIINVGNLNMGGTGKSPHIEYLIRLLSGKYKVATLSRGYKRKTTGFIIANEKSTIADIGDEPKQFMTKYPQLIVSVCEKRVNGIAQLIKYDKNPINAILLDDAFQHRSIKPGLNILLTNYNKPFSTDYIFPSGNLREFKNGYKRADIIIVTKCPKNITAVEKNRIIQEIKPQPYQRIFFSYIEYKSMVPFNKKEVNVNPENASSVLLFTGIANTEPLEKYLVEKKYNIQSVHFQDHHVFTLSDINKIKERFNKITDTNKIIITTEKDFMRFENKEFNNILTNLPIFYIPIEVNFFENDKLSFNKQVLDYIEHDRKN